MGPAHMTAIDPDQFEVLCAELVEALARMVRRATLADMADIGDFINDLDAAQRTLLVHLAT